MENAANLTIDINVANFIFRARRPVLSLPPFHGARWAAWLRFGCRKEKIDIEHIKGLYPLRHGKKPISIGENVIVRILIDQYCHEILPRLVNAFELSDIKGQFSPESLELVRICDMGGQPVWLKGRDSPGIPLRPSRELIREEAEHLTNMTSWKLEFGAPLRLNLPSGMKGEGEIGKYCTPVFFQQPQSSSYLISRTVFLSPGLERRPGWNMLI